MATPPTLDQVCAKALQLPCSPVLLPRLVAVLQKEDSPAEDLENIIKLDPALAGSTIRLANSAYFASSAPVETLSEAIFRLGHREIYRLAALSLAGRWMKFSAAGYSWEPGDFCRYALCQALAGEQLAEQTRRVDPRTAYTAGLVCTLGKLAIAYACSEWFAAIREYQVKNACPWTTAENSILGYDYAAAGARLLSSWKFPPALVVCAEHQAMPAYGPEEYRDLLAHMHAAQYLASAMGAGVAEDGFLYEIDGSFLTEWGFTPELLDSVLSKVLDRASSLLQEKLTTGAVNF